MGLKVIWSAFAENKLRSVYDYYRDKASIRVAKDLTVGIVEATIYLNDHPNIGQIENLLLTYPEQFRYILYKQYKVIYFVDRQDAIVNIVNVFDSRQNPKKMIDELITE